MLNARRAQMTVSPLATGREVKMGADLVEQADFLRLDAGRRLDTEASRSWGNS